ncbi:MAG: CBS domain-containing protein [bacterium]
MLLIRDVMTRHVFTVTPETTMREAADLFARHHISGAPVFAGHTLVGVVSATDLLEFIASNEVRSADVAPSDQGFEERSPREFEDEAVSLFFNDRLPENDPREDEPFVMDDSQPADLFSDHTVDEVMTRDICSLSSDADVGEAARYMWRLGIHRLVILDQGHLAGILSMSDLAQVVGTAP